DAEAACARHPSVLAVTAAVAVKHNGRELVFGTQAEVLTDAWASGQENARYQRAQESDRAGDAQRTLDTVQEGADRCGDQLVGLADETGGAQRFGRDQCTTDGALGCRGRLLGKPRRDGRSESRAVQ